MSAHLIFIYDAELERALSGLGFKREDVGVYARTSTESIWEGAWVVFTEDMARLKVAPNLALFCPRASRLINKILAKLYGKAVNYGYSKLGRPFVSEQLYGVVVEKLAEGRSWSSYDVEEKIDVALAAKLVYDDFLRVNRQFFNETTTIEKLRDRIASHPINASAGIDAMVLTYIANPNVSLDELERYARLSQNAMTREFSMYFKTEVIEERAQKKS